MKAEKASALLMKQQQKQAAETFERQAQLTQKQNELNTWYQVRTQQPVAQPQLAHTDSQQLFAHQHLFGSSNVAADLAESQSNFDSHAPDK